MKLPSIQLNERRLQDLAQQLDQYAILHKLSHEIKTPVPSLNNEIVSKMNASTMYHQDIDMKSSNQVTTCVEHIQNDIPTLHVSHEVDLIVVDYVESDKALNAYHKYQQIRKRRYKVWSRSSKILKQFVGMFFEVHNGKQFIPLTVVEDMVGHRFGEFASTRKLTVHKVAKSKK
uniref:Ribosomal protein S19 n=1 Tax=Picobiliphyte sp. MS584-11 TaxID=1157699 RepID=A0A2H4R8P9_9EUKA|nr:ribosomal protein S19 [Picobiliphyte sp. MS584-11]